MRNVLIAVLTILPGAAFAQPIIYNRGIVNAASYMQAGLPGGSIARGSLFTIFGSRLGPGTSPALSFPLSTTLGDVTIQVKQGSTTVAAIPVFVSAGQINAILPSNAPLGAVSIYVTFNTRTSPPVTARVVDVSVGLFAFNSGGFGPALMQNFVSQSSTPVNTPTVAAKPGQAIVLYATGLGAGLNADNQQPQPGNLPPKVELFIGGISTPVSYSGRSGCCSGFDQINFVVPANAPLGCWVPLQVRTNNTTVSNTVTMAISADGSPCTDSVNPLTGPFLAGKKIGLIGLLRTDITEDVGRAKAGQVTTDAVMFTFQREDPVPAAPFNPFFSLPPPGTCTAYSAPGDLFDGDPFPGADDAGAKFLNAGSRFTVASPNQSVAVRRPDNNARNFQALGYQFTGNRFPSTLLLNPSELSVTGAGGSDVGPIQAAVTIPDPAGLTWTNRDQTTIISRSQGFTVNWSNAPAGQSVIIYGGGVDLATNASAVFACLAAAGATSFNVPATALANIAPTRVNLLQSKGAIYVGALPVASPPSLAASGVDAGAVVFGAFAGKTVIFQ